MTPGCRSAERASSAGGSPPAAPREFVRRAVVDDDDLELRVGLREDALDGLVEVTAEVVTGNDDGDERPGHRIQRITSALRERLRQQTTEVRYVGALHLESGRA